jgi:hypothetical protein
MATEIDIAVTTTTYDVTIVAEPNEYIVNITTGGGGGNQTLAQTLVLGNTTGGENILINDADAIELENTSLLKKGTYDFGGDGGISRICSNQYEDNWQSGFRHVFDQSGFIRHSTNCFDVIPDSSFDNTLRFKVDSLWTLDNGTTYKCTDASTGAAVWEQVVNTPNLTEVLTVGNKGWSFIDLGAGNYTFALNDRLTTNFVVGTTPTLSEVFLDKTVIYPDNSVIEFQPANADEGGGALTAYPFTFTTDAVVYYNGVLTTSLTINVGDKCTLKNLGLDINDFNYWVLTVTNKSSIPNLTQVLTQSDVITNYIVIGANDTLTLQIPDRLTENIIDSSGRGTTGEILLDSVQFPENSKISFRFGGFWEAGDPEKVQLGAPLRFDVDVRIYYLDTVLSNTSIFINPTDICNLSYQGYDELNSQTIWFLQVDKNAASGTVTSVGLTMPSAFTVTNSPITSSGDIAVTGAGAVSQYVRGDGSLANFPTSSGGGSSLSFYFNGSVSQGTFGGVAFREMDRTPILGAGTNFNINTNGYIQSFITDAGVPNLLGIPAGNWNFETYFSASSGGGTPSFYIELYKWDGVTLSLIASSSANPEVINNGTVTDLYVSALAVPQTTLLATDRLAVRIWVNNSGRTITLHTEDNNLCQVITTFSTGLTALNGLTAQVQNLAVGTTGTDFAINSTTSTHTFNLPTASALNRGALSSADWTTFNNKLNVASPSFTGILSGAGTTQTGSSAVGILDLSQTWNTTGNPTALKVNVTNTASGSSSLLIDLQTGGTSRFTVNRTGLITAGGLSMSGADATARYFGAQNGLPSGYNSAFQGFGTAFAHTSGEKSTFVDELSWSPSSGSGSKSSYTFSGTINQTGTATGITRGIYINPTLTSAVDFRAIDVVAGKLMFSSTIIPSGTTGAATINKISGKVNAAAGSTSLVVTNSLVTTSSIVMCQIGTNDATCVIKSVVEANGSFTINFIAPTAETVIKFKVIN